MSDCLKLGCKNLETKCVDCGRLVNEYKFPNLQTMVINEYYEGMRWISVKDRLPNDRDYVLTFSDGLISTQMFYINEISRAKKKHWYFSDNSDEWIDNNVTHWMPLPKPPEETNEPN